jgi:hypothetical protein
LLHDITLQGGGLFMRGLQNDKLGSTGQALLHNVMLHNNTAGFGGAVACDNCRAVLFNTSMTHNIAVRRDSEATGSKQQQRKEQPDSMQATTIVTVTNSSSSSNGSSNASANALITCQGDDVQAAPAPLMVYQVRGAGGAIAANMAGNSFLVLCDDGSSSSRNALLHNHAQAVGGAFYVNYTLTAGCAGPEVDQLHNLTCFPGVGASAADGGVSQLGCGLTTVNVDWSNSSSDAGGDLLGWAGADGFRMICSSSSSSNGSSCNDIPINGSNGAADSSNRSSNGQGACFVSYTAGDAYACLPAAAAVARDTQDRQQNLSAAAAAGSHLTISSPGLRFELPNSLGVFNSTCLQQQEQKAGAGQVANTTRCAVAGLHGASMPKVFSGGECCCCCCCLYLKLPYRWYELHSAADLVL